MACKSGQRAGGCKDFSSHCMPKRVEACAIATASETCSMSRGEHVGACNARLERGSFARRHDGSRRLASGGSKMRGSCVAADVPMQCNLQTVVVAGWERRSCHMLSRGRDGGALALLPPLCTATAAAAAAVCSPISHLPR